MISSEKDVPCATTAKKSEMSKNTDAESPQSRKRKLSSDHEQQSPSKITKHDIEDVSSAVSFLIVCYCLEC